MNPKTLTALKASIAHWKKMRRDPQIGNPMSDECALCRLFRLRGRAFTDECGECPVAIKAGEHLCMGTPYANAHQSHADAIDLKTPSALKRWRIAATAEIDFLESLLPK